MLAITGAYRTSSTNCLAAVAGTLPLDLEIRHQAAMRDLAREKVSNDEMDTITDELVNEWQERYTSMNKGSWTQKMIPSVRQRYHLPLVLDHYTTQFLTGHGDFKRIMREEREAWPPANRAFLKSRRTFSALKSFAREALTNRDDI